MFKRLVKGFLYLHQSKSGVSLLEMAVSLTLFSITASVFIVSLTPGLRVTEMAVEESDANTVATSQVENTLGQAYAEPPIYPTVATTGGLTISFDNFVLDPTLLQRITITIADEDKTLLELTTYKTNEVFVASPLLYNSPNETFVGMGTPAILHPQPH